MVPASGKDTVWTKCIECKIQDGDIGNFLMIYNIRVVIDGKRTTLNNYTCVKKKRDGERSTGEWNHFEAIFNKGKITYIVNGVVVNDADKYTNIAQTIHPGYAHNMGCARFF